MSRSLLVCLILATALAAARAQTPPGEAKKSEPKARPAVDQLKPPPGSVIVISKDVDKAMSLWPEMILMSPEKYQALTDRLAALEKQLKAEKTLTHSCKLTGKLEGEVVALRADFTFATETPRSTVVLGLQKAHLTGEGELDGQPPALDYSEEDGFTVRVAKEGNHQLTLQLRVPLKRSTGAGGVERGFELGLPGATVTTLALDLPPGVKEVRWNDQVEKSKTQGRWLLTLGKSKSLNLSWREPVVVPGNGPLLTAEGQVAVRLDENQVTLTADLALEDLRGQTKEWHLLLPAAAKVEVKAPPGAAYELLPPDGKHPYHVLRLPEPNAERWHVSALVRAPRPGPGARLPVGPFFVQGAYRQQGTVTIQVAADAARRQRLLYHRLGEVFQRDLPKNPATPEVEAVFQYWNLPAPGKKGPAGYKVPLELELKSEKVVVEAWTDHALKLRPTGDGWEVELTARVQAKAPYGGDFLDVQLPRPRPPSLAALAVSPGALFPASVPWPALWQMRGQPLAWSELIDFDVSEEGGGVLDVPPPDAQGRTRVPLPRGTAKHFALQFKGKYLLPPQNQRGRLPLPRLLGVTDRGGKLTVQADEQLELLVGPAGNEEPVPEKHRYQVSAAESPAFVDLAWRGYRPAFPVEAVADVTVHERTAQVRQQLRFPPPPRPGSAFQPQTGQIRLLVPDEVKTVTVVAGTQRTRHEPDGGGVWVTPARNEAGETRELVLEYDLPLRDGDGQGPTRTAGLTVPLVWPKLATRMDARLRVWSDAGTRVRVDASRTSNEAWKDRGAEPVAGRDALPALVLQGNGPSLPVTLHVEQAPPGSLAALVCDRALMQATVDEDGGQLCRARYMLRKVNAGYVDIELPLPAADCLQTVLLGSNRVSWEPVPAAWNVARIPLTAGGQPVVLDLEYKLPASFAEGRRPWQTTLFPPQFRSPVLIGRMRWQLSLAQPGVAVTAAKNASLDYQWGLHGWLPFPEPSVNGAELEAWLTGHEAAAAPSPVTLSYTRVSQEPQRVYHVPRPLWLLLCSGSALLLFFALFFLPFARRVAVGLLVLLGLALGAGALLWPTLAPAVAAGALPGLLVIGLVLGVHWLLQERYRRQVVFIPGFTRAAGSSLVRHGSGKRPREAASTLDAPPASGVANAGLPSSKPK